MFCEKKDKYKKGSKNRENLTQASQLRTDIIVRNSAELKMDSRVLALLSREQLPRLITIAFVIDSTPRSLAPVLKFPNKMKIQSMNLMIMLTRWPWSNCSIMSEMIS